MSATLGLINKPFWLAGSQFYLQPFGINYQWAKLEFASYLVKNTMVKTCAVFGCTARDNKDSSTSFHG